MLVALGAEGGYGQGLGFAAREEGGTVGTRQYAGLNVDGAYGAGVAAVNARLAGQNLAAHHIGFQMFENAFDLVGGQGVGVFRDQRGLHSGPGFVQLSGARLFLADFEGFGHGLPGNFLHFGYQGGIGFGRFPVPHFGVDRIGQLVDGADNGLHFIVAVYHGAEHHVFGQDLGFGFHHQHGLRGTGHHQIQLRFGQLGFGRVQHVFAVQVTHASGTDGAGERHAAQHQRGGSADHGGDVGIDFRINRYHRGHDLDVVEEAFGEQRADGAVDQAAGEDFFFALFAFALEEAAGDFACGIGALQIIHGEREEILPGFHFFIGGNGHQHHGFAHGYFHRTRSLTSDFAGFDGYGVLAVLEGFDVFVKHEDSFRRRPLPLKH